MQRPWRRRNLVLCVPPVEEEQRELEERRMREEAMANESVGMNTDNNLPVSAPNSPFSPKKVRA